MRKSEDVLLVHLLILVFLALLKAFFALSEIAVVIFNDKKIRKLSSQCHAEVMKVLKFLSNLNVFLVTIQVGVILSWFLTSASVLQNFAAPLAEVLKFLPVPEEMFSSIATVAITLILSYSSLIFGELVTENAMQDPEKVLFKVEECQKMLR